MISLQIIHRKVEKTKKETRWNLDDENGWSIYKTDRKQQDPSQCSQCVQYRQSVWDMEERIDQNTFKKKTIRSEKVTVAKTVRELIEKKRELKA